MQLKFYSEGEGVAETIVEDGNLFILHNRTQKDFIHFWVTIMGDKEDALRYRYELTLENETENNNKVNLIIGDYQVQSEILA